MEEEDRWRARESVMATPAAAMPRRMTVRASVSDGLAGTALLERRLGWAGIRQARLVTVIRMASFRAVGVMRSWMGEGGERVGETEETAQESSRH